jgi:predicted nucleic acid-binding protein
MDSESGRRRAAQDPRHTLTRQAVEQASQEGWLKTRMASNASLISLLTVEVHLGEAEAIALAPEMKADCVLIDERDGRLRARQPSSLA